MNLQSHLLRSAQQLCSRRILKLVLPLVIVLTVAAVVVQSSHGVQDSRLAKMLPSYQDWVAEHKGPSRSHIDSVRVTPVDGIKVSPLELIPEFDQDMENRRRASWNFLGRNRQYRKFNELDKTSQCYFYFRNLYNMNSKWGNDFQRWAFALNENVDHADAIKDSDGVTLSSQDSINFHKRINNVALSMERMRVYDTCFAQDNSVDFAAIFDTPEKSGTDSNAADADILASALDPNREYDSENSKRNTRIYRRFDQWDLEHRMWPIIRYFTAANFSGVMPKFTGSGGQLDGGILPIMHTGGREVHQHVKYTYDPRKSFLQNWNAMSSLVANRGIVLSFGDGQKEMASKLIATLRYMGNELPIQVVTKGDIADETVRDLLKIAQADKLEYPTVQYDHGKDVPQQLWFVDVSPTLDPGVINEFSHFKNKWLAALFNTFEEYAFIDIDAITYVDFEEYFNSIEYHRTGTVFFKDRHLTNGVSDKCAALFSTMYPHFLESKYFGHYAMVNEEYVEEQCSKFLTTEEKIFSSFFIDRNQHQMESGLVVVDKNAHMIPLMMATLLNMAKKSSSCGYGDKEYFWLGFLVSGHDYAFNSVPAGAIGDVSKIKEVNRDLQEEKYEICNVVLAHMTDDNRLLWANGGSHYCKFNAAEDDFKPDSFWSKRVKSVDELRGIFEGVIDARTGIIAAEKDNSWGHLEGCRGYIWCARYEKHIKPYTFDKVVEKGKMIKFDPELVKRYNAINNVWAANYL
ncbi:LAMI_0H12728g1_1 [Lachancea mirantina]|uniref:LAMI_0H12728g1_1 n=1 Tax=Lachancea mirantina TaxID=1230905 RepID=A0A1G4KHS1_9SACH|nr:LAMI_0H12728g1_1 [Lachancea mirantina]